jgi:hypothetical protein
VAAKRVITTASCAVRTSTYLPGDLSSTSSATTAAPSQAQFGVYAQDIDLSKWPRNSTRARAGVPLTNWSRHSPLPAFFLLISDFAVLASVWYHVCDLTGRP